MKRRIKVWVPVVLYVWFFAFAPKLLADEPPSLPMKESIPIAEEALKDAKIDLNKYYLYQIEYSLTYEGNYWFQTYRPYSSEDGEIFVKIYMDGKTEISGTQR